MESELLFRILDKLYTMDTGISGIKTELAKHSEDIADIKTELATVNTRLDSLEDKSDEQNHRLVLLENKFDLNFKLLHDGYKLLDERTSAIKDLTYKVLDGYDNYHTRLLVIENSYLKKSV